MFRSLFDGRAFCDVNYYGSDCETHCRPRDDRYNGHYTCNSNGAKKCLEGWMNEHHDCRDAKCLPGCNPIHGSCKVPNECICQYGYKGVNCDECIVYPGCQHGYCVKPFECHCNLGWGGMLCDQDLDYCSTHQPCLNAATCLPVKPNRYKCLCREGYDGENCQIIINPCVTQPCHNRGTCFKLNNSSYVCQCQPGFTGQHCEVNVNECNSNPCSNGGTCVDEINSYRCQCPPGLKGSHCEEDVNECESKLNPCSPLNTEVCRNTFGSFECLCKKGFDGKLCEENIDECFSNPCLNQGKCVDLIDSFQCVCEKGFKGKLCEQIDESICQSNEQIWQLRHNHHCLAKWCTCKSRPVCKCIQTLSSVSGSSSASAASSSASSSSSSLRIIFDEQLDANKSELFCASLEAILTLSMHDTVDLETMRLVCRIDTPQSVQFYSQSDAYTERVLQLGDLVSSMKQLTHVKQIIKEKQQRSYLTLINVCSLLVLAIAAIAFTFSILFLVVKKFYFFNRFSYNRFCCDCAQFSQPSNDRIHNVFPKNNQLKNVNKVIDVQV
ncbi:delta protein-like protein [Dinothrombium tinctorium]|uniref:Delta-like protein n=1 Tax=Dinothrombium tinctorium TaxID=1965070 RepID=A0A443QS53_9ACAR|nr:delta protein-like protein [Dinothrombium tinctorium]